MKSLLIFIFLIPFDLVNAKPEISKNLRKKSDKISIKEACMTCKIYFDCEIENHRKNYGKVDSIHYCRLNGDKTKQLKPYKICSDFREKDKENFSTKKLESAYKNPKYLKTTSSNCIPIDSIECQRKIAIEGLIFHYNLHCGDLRKQVIK